MAKTIRPILVTTQTSSFQRETRAALSDIGLYDFLVINRLPCFVLRLSISESQTHMRIAYCNPALLGRPQLHDKLREQLDQDVDYKAVPKSPSEFAQWILAERTDAVTGSSFMFKSYVWSNCCTIENRYVLVSGSPCAPTRYAMGSLLHDEEPSESAQVADNNFGAKATIGYTQSQTPTSEQVAPKAVTFDLTAGQYDKRSLTSHQKYVVELDWASTSLGGIRTWSAELRAAFNMVMTDVHASVVFFGKENVLIYNELYPPLIEGSHPCVGKPALQALPRYSDVLRSIFGQIRENGQTVYYEDLPLFYSRDSNDSVEGYFSLKTSPLLDSSGAVTGFYQLITESTNRILLQRRIDTFISIGAQMIEASTLPDIWRLIIDSMALNNKDIPFAVIYGLTDDVVDLKGSINVPEGHAAIAESFHLESDNVVGFGPLFRDSMKSRKLLVVHVTDESLPEALIKDIQSQAFGDTIKSVAISPILNGSRVLGFLVIGCNPRRPFDDPYSAFISQLSRMIAAGVASTVLIEEAAVVRAGLEQQLTDHQRRLQQQGKWFRALAERVGVAIFVTDVEGRYTFRNDTWFQLFPSAGGDLLYQSTLDRELDTESREVAANLWQNLLGGKDQLRVELKLKRKWESLERFEVESDEIVDHHFWVLASAFPTCRDDGSVEEITCVFTDISHQKWSERTQQLRTDVALESRRHLEQFIDTTSHEIRNPLSAITHCADDLLFTAEEALIACEKSSKGPIDQTHLLREMIESTQTIVSCSSHMKRIVDDVLTVSKLNGSLLLVTPIEVQPDAEIEKILKMFKAEAEAADVTLLPLSTSDRYHRLDVHSVKMDPVRVSQVMVNLISNAIKFTRFESIRQIQITLDASLTKPSAELNGCLLLHTGKSKQENVVEFDDANEQVVFIIISVKDTGKGLSDLEANDLFTRFSQGSPRTYIQYGGNGLGLFISRMIVELHGGAIGFSSRPHEGSTFTFYVKASRLDSSVRSKSRISSQAASAINNISEFSPPVANGHEAQSSNPKAMNREQVYLLVVEDNLINQKILVKQLRKLGYKVDAANDGLECLDYIKTTRCWSSNQDEGKSLSLILLDWEMPNCNGLTCAKKIRELQEQKEITGDVIIVGITANVRPQQIEEALTAGMDDVVSKPFHISELEDKICVLLDQPSHERSGRTLALGP